MTAFLPRLCLAVALVLSISGLPARATTGCGGEPCVDELWAAMIANVDFIKINCAKADPTNAKKYQVKAKEMLVRESPESVNAARKSAFYVDTMKGFDIQAKEMGRPAVIAECRKNLPRPLPD